MSQRGRSRGRGGCQGRGNFHWHSPNNHQNTRYPNSDFPAQNQPHYGPPPPFNYPQQAPGPAPYQISVTIHPQAPQPKSPLLMQPYAHSNDAYHNYNPHLGNDQYYPPSPQDPHHSNRHRPPSPNIRSRHGGHHSFGQDVNPNNSSFPLHQNFDGRRPVPQTRNYSHNDPPPSYESCVEPRGDDFLTPSGRGKREQKTHHRREDTVGDQERTFQSSRRNSSQSDISCESEPSSSKGGLPRKCPGDKVRSHDSDRGGKKSHPKQKEKMQGLHEESSSFTKKNEVGEKKFKESGSNRRGKPLNLGFAVDSMPAHEKEPANFSGEKKYGRMQDQGLEKFSECGRGGGLRGRLSHGVSLDSLNKRDTNIYSSMESLKSRESGVSGAYRGQKRGRGANRGRGNYHVSHGEPEERLNNRDADSWSFMESMGSGASETSRGHKRGRGLNRGRGNYHVSHGESEERLNNRDTDSWSFMESMGSGASETFRGHKRGRGMNRGRGNYHGGQKYSKSGEFKPDKTKKEPSCSESDSGVQNNYQAKKYRRFRQRHKKHKKPGMESGTEKEEEIELDIEEQCMPIRYTRAELSVCETFKDTESFKKTVIEHLPEHDDVEYEIDEGSIICTEKGSFCTIIVQAESKQLAKHLIKNICKNIKKKLKKDVYHMISSVDKENATSSALFASQRHKQVVDILATPGVSMNEAPMKHADEQDRKISRQDLMQIPTKLSVTIGKIFPERKDVTDFLNRAVGEKIPLFEVLFESIGMSQSKTFCELIASTKANSKRVSKKLNSSKFEDVSIFCQVISQAVKQDDNSKEKQWKEEFQRSLTEIERKTSSTLENHRRKINLYEQALDVMQNVIQASLEHQDDFDDDQIEALAIRDKLVEALKQEKEFQSHIEFLTAKIKEVDPVLSTAKDLTQVLQNVGVECRRLETALPMYARRKDVVTQVISNQVSIILGETGSGKSTQMAQYLYEAGLAGEQQIACTQPRKVAAITLAERVANEMVSKLGGLVGYKTGIKKKFSNNTKILFLTDHSLLNECLQDPKLTKYSCIIVDEAHERSIYTDLLLGMIKACLPERPDLKVIITSATIDPDIFIRYFNSGPELQVSGRAFPVDVIYDNTDGSEDFENFESKAVSKAVEIHKNLGPGDILVFLTSSVEIMRCCDEFEKRMCGQKNFKCFPLHGQLPPDEQKKVFEHLPQGIRKIIFATNCAETSITIDGIKYVIDTGVAKEMKYDPKKNISLLDTHVVSKSSADQRKGRAGRTASGKCFRLYSENGYESMASITEPEILRVHLGQAVLKLAELGVDVKTYDFVQPPSPDAVDSAVSTLQELGALSAAGITDVGRWISKLPFDPRQGFLVYHGYKENLLYDSVVLASLVSHGSNLFYRGLNESEEQRSAQSKHLFGSPYGDIFTWLEVYKTWSQLAKNEQSKWCRDKCINYKVLSFTKQCVDEVATILTKELDSKLERSFSSDEKALTTLRKVLFDANMSSVCHFLGHLRAGYYAALLDRQVHFHPSSCLLSHNSQPEWVVYTEFTKTSRDFIRGITVIEEQWVLDAISQGKLPIDMTEIKKKSIELVHREEVGSLVFHKLVGPRYSKVRELEESLTRSGMATVVVEADRDLGTLNVFSSSPMDQVMVQHLTQIKNEVLETLKWDEHELAIISTSGRDQCGFRAALGQGGSVKALFMPGQTNRILIKKHGHGTTKDDIREKFEKFGDIKQCVQFKSPEPWGFIRFDSYAQALAAAQATGKDEENAAFLDVDDRRKNTKSKFEARLSWCRRPIKGKGMAFIKVPPVERASLIGKGIIVGGRLCEIKVSNKEDNMELICSGTGRAQEHEIKEEILNLLDYDEDMKDKVRVSVLREKAHTLSKDEIKEIKDDLSQDFMRYIDKSKFHITLNSAKENAIWQVAFIRFDSLLSGFHACKMLKGQLSVNEQTVEISPKLKTSVFVSKAVMNVCGDRLQEIINGLKKYRDTEVNVRTLGKGDSSVEILSQEAESIVEAKDVIQKELEGEVINCGINQVVKILLKHQSKDFLLKIQKDRGVLIILDDRKEELHVYGTVKSVNGAKIDINEYLDKLFVDGEPAEFYLRGADKPPGLMKALIQEFDSLRDGLIQRFNLTDVLIDFKKQKLSLFGSSTAVEETVTYLSQLQNGLQLSLQLSLRQETGNPDCVVCMCPVDSKSELYRLQSCGHSYCLECLKLQVTVSVNDKIFPLICCKEDCSEQLVWKDFRMFLTKMWIVEEKLVQMSVNSFVTENPKKYKFCKTPNCPVVYEITDDEEGCEFNCPLCNISICTSCHTSYHVGLTCKMALTQSESDRLVEEWIRADPHTRKHCPGCKGGVEKISGCNKMMCVSCKTYFCWLCLTVCQDEQDCYKHLMKKHGSFT